MVYNTGSTNLDLHTVSAEPNLVVCGRDLATKQRLTHQKIASIQVTHVTWQSACTVCHWKQLLQQ